MIYLYVLEAVFIFKECIFEWFFFSILKITILTYKNYRKDILANYKIYSSIEFTCFIVLTYINSKYVFITSIVVRFIIDSIFFVCKNTYFSINRNAKYKYSYICAGYFFFLFKNKVQELYTCLCDSLMSRFFFFVFELNICDTNEGSTNLMVKFNILIKV